LATATERGSSPNSADVDSAVAFIFSWAPFSNYKGYFNVFGSKVVSVDSGLAIQIRLPIAAARSACACSQTRISRGLWMRSNIHRLLGFNATTVCERPGGELSGL
jgi:hypothetical protein